MGRVASNSFGPTKHHMAWIPTREESVAGDFIEQFMWGYQPHFAGVTRVEVEKLLEVMGCASEASVVLVGLATSKEEVHQVCIEPEKKNYFPEDFAGISERSREIYEQHPRSQVIHFDAGVHDSMHASLRNWARAQAIKEVLEERYPGGGWTFFVGRSVPIAGYDVHTAIGIPNEVVDSVPSLAPAVGPRDTPLTRSLLEAAMAELLHDVFRALHLPDPGRDLVYTFNRTVNEMLRSAGDQLVKAAVMRTGEIMVADVFEAVTELATMRYEKRVGLGRITIVSPDNARATVSLRLLQPVAFSALRTLRKLLEMSSARGLTLLSNGETVYGLGNYSGGDDHPEDAYEITIEGQGTWNLRVAGRPLMHVQYGVPRLPETRLDSEEFAELAIRVLGADCKVEELWNLAEAAAAAEHGTMLVVSTDALVEAQRLGGQAILVQPTQLNDETLRHATSIDGAILIDPQANVQAIGVILDGTASEGGDPSRGARYNSAVRYLAQRRRTLVMLVSEDGMINLLPKLHRRIRRQDVSDAIDALRRAIHVEDGRFDRSDFSRAYRKLRSLGFYLTEEQCDEINALRRQADSMRDLQEVRIVYDDLAPDPRMSDEYFIDELPTAIE